MASYKIEGLKDLEKAFEELANVNQRKASARRAMKKAAQPMADQAQRLAPRDSGDLGESVKIGTRLSKRQSAKHRKIGGRAAVEMFVGAGPLPSAHLQEFGTEHSAPQPFMRPALDGNARGYLDTIAKELWADLRKTVERAERKAAKLRARG